jgi:hypothetical protein
MAREELYVIHKDSGRRVAVPKAHFESTLKAQGYVIDPEGPSAGEVDTRTVRAAERSIERAQTKKTDEAED